VQANRERGLPPMSKDEVDMLCYCVITCETLAEVIERAQRFCAMLDHRAADLSLDTTGTQAIFHMATQRLKHSASGLLTDLNGLSFYHRLFAWLIGTPIPVRGYEVYAEPMVDAVTLEGFYGQPIRFGCEDNRFAFPARLLAKPVVRSYSSLLERLRVFPFEQVAPGLDGRLADAVKRILASRVARGAEQPSMEQFAGLFNLSRATFQRRLRAEGTGLEQIRRDVLLELARELLRDGANLKLAEIAGRLGFSDARAFRRAFIAWTGEGPDAWRRGEQRG
jgi:AraC-like DNA-binding protein